MHFDATISAHAIDRFAERIEPDSRSTIEDRIHEVLTGVRPRDLRIRHLYATGQAVWDVRSDDFVARVTNSREEPERLVVVTVLEPRRTSRAKSTLRRQAERWMTWTRGGDTRPLRWKLSQESPEDTFDW